MRLATALILGLLIGPGFAQADDKEAKRHFQQGQTAYDVGQFEEALTSYQEAYKQKPHPAFLFNIGQCYRQLKNYDRAAFFFRRYLTLSPKAANAPQVRVLLGEVEGKLAQQTAGPDPEAESKRRAQIDAANEVAARAEAAQKEAERLAREADAKAAAAKAEADRIAREREADAKAAAAKAEADRIAREREAETQRRALAERARPAPLAAPPPPPAMAKDVPPAPPKPEGGWVVAPARAPPATTRSVLARADVPVVAAAAPAGAVEAESRPVTKRWWFWTAIGVVAAGAAAVAVVALSGPAPGRVATLGDLNTRK